MWIPVDDDGVSVDIVTERVSATVPQFHRHFGDTFTMLDETPERMATAGQSGTAAKSHHDGCQHRALSTAVQTHDEVYVVAESTHTKSKK